MGARHAARWNNLAEARVVAVADVSPERGRALAQACGLERAYADYREALVLPEVDVVSICVPTCFHADVAVAAARRRKHVLSEKPIALTLTDADRMIRAAADAGVSLGVGFMRRQSPALHALRALLGEGGLGRPVMYTALDARELRPKREMHDPAANGGPLIDMGVHLFDSWAYLFDSHPVAVYAQGLRLASGRAEIAHIPVPAVDTATVVVTYQSGDIGTFVVTWGLPAQVNPAGEPDAIYGPLGMAVASFGLWHQELTVGRTGRTAETLVAADEDMFQREIEAFARCILEHRPVPVTGEDGVAALRVALAALESIALGQVVRLAP